MAPWLRYAIALVVGVHGLVYVNAARGVLPVFDGWSGRSWLLGGALTGEPLRRTVVALWTVAGVGVVATAVAIGLAFAVESVWRPIAIVASAAGIVGFFLFWDGQPQHLLSQGAVGTIASLVILVAAIALPRVMALLAV